MGTIREDLTSAVNKGAVHPVHLDSLEEKSGTSVSSVDGVSEEAVSSEGKSRAILSQGEAASSGEGSRAFLSEIEAVSSGGGSPIILSQFEAAGDLEKVKYKST